MRLPPLLVDQDGKRNVLWRGNLHKVVILCAFIDNFDVTLASPKTLTIIERVVDKTSVPNLKRYRSIALNPYPKGTVLGRIDSVVYVGKGVLDKHIFFVENPFLLIKRHNTIFRGVGTNNANVLIADIFRELVQNRSIDASKQSFFGIDHTSGRSFFRGNIRSESGKAGHAAHHHSHAQRQQGHNFVLHKKASYNVCITP